MFPTTSTTFQCKGSWAYWHITSGGLLLYMADYLKVTTYLTLSFIHVAHRSLPNRHMLPRLQFQLLLQKKRSQMRPDVAGGRNCNS